MNRLLLRWLRAAWAAPPAAAPPGTWILAGLERLYRLGLRGRRDRTAPEPAIPVVSVGSLWAGGGGKTPLTAALARMAAEEELLPAVVLRGYGGRVGRRVVRIGPGQANPLLHGDEACLHAREAGVAVYLSADRPAAVRQAAEDGRRIALLDDGMQHRRIIRRLEIVTLPAVRPFANRRLLPRGPLREPPAAIAGADLVVLAYATARPTRPGEREEQEEEIRRLAAGASILRWRGALRLCAAEAPPGAPLPAAAPLRVGALSGIGRPESFRASLEEAGCEVVWEAAFPDHHRFRPRDLRRVAARARSEPVDVVVTTQKDAVRLPGVAAIGPVPLAVARLELLWESEEAERALRVRLRALVER